MSNKIYDNDKNLLNDILIKKPLLFCINDDEKDPIKRIKVREDMLKLFESYYPEKPIFEK